MHDRQPSAEHAIASDPSTPPHVLVDLASHRWELHGLIASNPAAPAELIRWIRGVNPTVPIGRAPGSRAEPPQQGRRLSPWQPGQPHPRPVSSAHHAPALGPAGYAPALHAPRRRRRAGGWLAGGGCLAAVALAAVVALAGLGALLTSGGDATADTPSAATPDPAPTESSEIDTQLALYAEERLKIDELSLEFDESPVAWLVADFEWLFRQDQKVSDPNLTEFSAQTIAAQTKTFREDLEVSVAAAQARRVNTSGSVTEGIVDTAGRGFIDIQWDAATTCKDSERESWRTSGCIKKGDSLTVHLLPESEVSEWVRDFTVVHELAHVYQRADNASVKDYRGEHNDLLAQGLFQGDAEAMADCYALTYYDEWSLTNGDDSVGYGYVCDDDERQALRSWASSINAPMQ